MRQTLSIAYNDIGRLNDQLSFIGIQVSLVEKRATPIATSSTSASVRCSTCSIRRTNCSMHSLRRQERRHRPGARLVRSFAGMGRLLEQLTLKRVDPDEAPGGDEFHEAAAERVVPAARTGGLLGRSRASITVRWPK